MISKSMHGMGPAIPHLADKPGGLAGEIWDLRNDVDQACGRVETPGAGGTGVVAVEEWSAPPAADSTYFLPATVFTPAAHQYGPVVPDLAVPRNLVLDLIVGTGVVAGDAVIAYVDVDGTRRQLTVPLPAVTTTMDLQVAAINVVGVLLPAGIPPIDLSTTVSVGYGDAIGLGSPAKTRQMGVHVIDEYMDGSIISPITATFTDKTLAVPNGTYLPATVPDGTHTYLLTYERDNG